MSDPWYKIQLSANGQMRTHSHQQLAALDALRRRANASGTANFDRGEVRLQTWIKLQEGGYCKVLRQGKQTMDVLLLPEGRV